MRTPSWPSRASRPDASRRSSRAVRRPSPCSRTKSCPTPSWSSGRANISAGLRCLVCQNQSIDDSDASLAKDLRVLVREQLKAGDSDQQIKDYLVARYGNFILLKPPFEWDTAAVVAFPLRHSGARRGRGPAQPPQGRGQARRPAVGRRKLPAAKPAGRRAGPIIPLHAGFLSPSLLYDYCSHIRGRPCAKFS